MGRITLFTAIAFLLLGVSVLFSVIGEPMSDGKPAAVARAILSVLSVVFSGGLLRLCFDYFSFAKKAGNVSARTLELRRSSTVEPTDASRLLHDYQVARSKAPPIPNWYHRSRRDKLNALWKSLGSQI